ncbi:MAG: acetyl-CoA C-acetyltransferase [Anaerocolumna sp.]
MRKVVLAGACRSAIGKMGGVFCNTSAVDLGTEVVKETIRRANIPIELVDCALIGCVLQAGQGQNVARQILLKAGIPTEKPALTLNVVCGSGLQAVNMAAQMIISGESEIVIAGGVENMSMAPYLLKKARFGYRLGNAEIIDSLVNDSLWCAVNNYHMGITAENICEKWDISREEMDEYSYKSQKKANAAITSGKFKDEIVPIRINGKMGSIIAEVDESPRENVSLQDLSRLSPVFKKDGKVTAGNSSGINDGAAAVVVMSEERARELGCKPMATWMAGALQGVEPSLMGIGPVAATKKVLGKSRILLENVDLIEANEAFAAQAIAVQRELNFSENKLNVNGGAISLGHPVGASGCRILVTLLYEMQRRNLEIGLATLCVGGGMGCAALVLRE